MPKLSSQTSRLAVTLVLTLFIFSAFFVSGFTVSTVAEAKAPAYAPPADGGGTGQAAPGAQQVQPGQQVDVIRNGGFEQWGEGGLALEWEGYRNGQAWAAFYQESWPEAVRSGQYAQLMEIFQVEPTIQDRVIAIYQTVPVVPNATYVLTFYAIMRSQAPAADRNQFEFEMAWGVDSSGGENYEDVQTWNTIPLEEQFRLGSTGEFPEDIPLRYELVTGTIQTGDSNQLSLFIRGLKKFSTGTEVNFDVDDVSLVGPVPGAAPPATPVPQPTPGVSLPVSGAIVARNISVGVLVLGGLVLITLGVAAVRGLRQKRRE